MEIVKESKQVDIEELHIGDIIVFRDGWSVLVVRCRSDYSKITMVPLDGKDSSFYVATPKELTTYLQDAFSGYRIYRSDEYKIKFVEK